MKNYFDTFSQRPKRTMKPPKPIVSAVMGHHSCVSYPILSPTSKDQYVICPVETAGQCEMPPEKPGSILRCSQALNTEFRRRRQNIGSTFWSNVRKTLSFLALNLTISAAVNLSGCPARAMKENLLCLIALVSTLPMSSFWLLPFLSTLKDRRN